LKGYPYEEHHLDPVDWTLRKAHLAGDVEEVVTTPPPKKVSGNARSQYASVSSPTIESSPTVDPIANEQNIKFPHEAASATNETDTAPSATSKTNTMDHIGEVPVVHMVPPVGANGLTQSTVLPGAQESLILLVARLPTAQALTFTQEDDAIMDSSDDNIVQPSKKGHKNNHNSKSGHK
jgi:hypothetical protein